MEFLVRDKVSPVFC